MVRRLKFTDNSRLKTAGKREFCQKIHAFWKAWNRPAENPPYFDKSGAGTWGSIAGHGFLILVK
jgi:hypothetical protein